MIPSFTAAGLKRLSRRIVDAAGRKGAYLEDVNIDGPARAAIDERLDMFIICGPERTCEWEILFSGDQNPAHPAVLTKKL